jgi:hypothetical protein
MTSHIDLIVPATDGELQNVICDFKKCTYKKLIRALQEHSKNRRERLLRKFSYEAHKAERAKKYKLGQDSF